MIEILNQSQKFGRRDSDPENNGDLPPAFLAADVYPSHARPMTPSSKSRCVNATDKQYESKSYSENRSKYSSTVIGPVIL